MKRIIILCIISAIIYSCGDNKSSFEKVENEESKVVESKPTESILEESEAVCILDKLSLRESPSKQGKWITSISLGETVTFTGMQKKDSVSKNTFYKVKLAGGDEGWTRGDFIEIGGQVAVFLKNTEIYKRPDLLTKANKKYSQMDIVAVTNKQGDWVEVKGKRSEGKYIESGWIKSGSTSSDAIDIAAAKFGLAALAETDESKRLALLKDITGNDDLSSSKFIPVLQEILSSSLEAPEEEVIETVIENNAENDSI